ncbi:hypothetical protein CSAL01_01346 [Colletotrichum salicis]|uniref:Uncharacterized protein n=1 Tax=Colletotrichum salicis TaxID=1209931 RepID=A0A135UUM7_9PEZI|nr:hypothetical protein CSAL01_01346 [Colletotrichum salicis]
MTHRHTHHRKHASKGSRKSSPSRESQEDTSIAGAAVEEYYVAPTAGPWSSWVHDAEGRGFYYRSRLSTTVGEIEWDFSRSPTYRSYNYIHPLPRMSYYQQPIKTSPDPATAFTYTFRYPPNAAPREDQPTSGSDYSLDASDEETFPAASSSVLIPAIIDVDTKNNIKVMRTVVLLVFEHSAMPGGLSPAGFRLRSSSQVRVYSHEEIIFPKLYEEVWGSDGFGDNRTELERARIFLMRFAKMNPNPFMSQELQSIVMNHKNRTINALALAVQMRIFGNRHASFAATPLLQCIRFMLLKARVPEFIYSDKTKLIMDFYFDPTMARSIEPLPPDGIVYKYPSGRLKVAIVEKGAGKIQVHVYERRWIVKDGPRGPYIDYPSTARRRDQVVTLQESVTTLMSQATQQALFEGRPECVWPGSANIQIRKVEDRLLRRCHAAEFQDLIHLHAEGVTHEAMAKIGDFHVLFGADGAALWVRKSYFHGYENERGRSYTPGLAFDRPAGLPWSQPLNVFLTLGQTRYLLNASDHDGRGYLNMQLTEEEWHKMLAKDETVPQGFTENQVFAPSEDRESSLWRSISDGLKLFGFKESEVINVVRIPIVVQAVREGIQYLSPCDSGAINRPHALVAVAGDAAMTVHFWPGRGLNSGVKSGIALGDEIVHALNGGKFVGLPLTAMNQYNDFIMKLQDREHDKRSIPILNQSGTPETLGWLLSKVDTVPDNFAIQWLVGAMAQIAERLEQRGDWAFGPVANVEPQLRIVLRQMDSATLREMAVSFPWPTREMGGAEVLPLRSMKPEEKQKWLRGIWGLLRDEVSRDSQKRPPSRGDRGRPLSTSRFEAPRGAALLPPRAVSPSPQFLSPTPNNAAPSRSESTLRRSNANRGGMSPGPSASCT